MNRFWLILGKTYRDKISSKAFLATTIIFALVIALGANLQTIIGWFDNQGAEEEWTVSVSSESEELITMLQQQLGVTQSSIVVEEAGAPDGERERVENGEVDAFLEIRPLESGRLDATFFSDRLTASNESIQLQQALQTIQSNQAAAQLNISADELATLNMPVAFEQETFSDQAQTAEEQNSARGFVYIMIFIMYMSVLIYSMMIATDVATEKSSRVMEILISSVPPIQHISAKILGVGLVGLTQLVIWGIVATGAFQLSSAPLEGAFFEFFGFSTIKVSTVVYGVVFFLLGFFLYATMSAFLGSLVSRTEDLQQVLMPVNFLVIAASLIAFFTIGDPSGTFVQIMSYIPFFTPLVMFTRVGILTIPVWEPILGIVLMLLTIAFFAWLGARVYKGGVLMYNSSSSLKDIKKALRLSKKE